MTGNFKRYDSIDEQSFKVGQQTKCRLLKTVKYVVLFLVSQWDLEQRPSRK